MSSQQPPGTQKISSRTGARNRPGPRAPSEVLSRPLPFRSPLTPEQTQQHSPQAERSPQSASASVSPALPTVFDNDHPLDASYQTPDSSFSEDYFDPKIRETSHELKTIGSAKRQWEESVGDERGNNDVAPRSNGSPIPRSKKRNSCLAQTKTDAIRSAPNSPQDMGNLASTGSILGEKASRSTEGLTATKNDVPRNVLQNIESPHIGTQPIDTPPIDTPPGETPPRETPPRETPPREAPPRETPPRETPPRETPPGETPPGDKPQPDPFSTEDPPYCKPKFTRYSEERRIDSINLNIHKQLLAESTNKKSGSNITGWIYIYESPSHAEGHVKVGQTKNDTSRRVRAWQKCKIPIDRVEDTDRDAFEHFGLVEKLIMEELNNERMQFTCTPCKKTHIEWYKINKERAVKCKDRWRHWLKKHEPYDSRGVLKPYWHWKVMRIKKQVSTLDWDVWTNPWWFEKYVYKYETLESLPVIKHWRRHDLWYWTTGFILFLLLYILFWSWKPALCWVGALLIL